MCDNSAYKASALRPCKNQSANAEPAVSECVHGVRRSPNCQRTQCSISSLNVKNSSDGVASSIVQRHTNPQPNLCMKTILWFVGFGNDARNVLFQDV